MGTGGALVHRFAVLYSRVLCFTPPMKCRTVFAENTGWSAQPHTARKNVLCFTERKALMSDPDNKLQMIPNELSIRYEVQDLNPT